MAGFHIFQQHTMPTIFTRKERLLAWLLRPKDTYNVLYPIKEKQDFCLPSQVVFNIVPLADGHGKWRKVSPCLFQ